MKLLPRHERKRHAMRDACGDAAMDYPNDPTHILHLARAEMDILILLLYNVVHIFRCKRTGAENTEILSNV